MANQLQQLDEALKETFNDLAAFLAKKFTDEIRAEKWTWPNEPSPRDIVDSGNLAKSLRVEPATVESDGRILVGFKWATEYAAAVHDGAVFRRPDARGNLRTMPARPWTRPVLYQREKIQAYVRKRFALAMRRRQGP
jgi:hypothetical protein